VGFARRAASILQSYQVILGGGIMSEQQYFALNEKEESELKRLKLLEELYDTVTIRHLETTRVSEGWKCLEVGGGAGSTAKWLSERVGLSGKVVATDIELRFLRLMNIPNLEIRQHDITKDELEVTHYDLVHSRCLLEHLPGYKKALQRMAEAVRPGGWLVIEDLDQGALVSVSLADPSATLFGAILQAGRDFLQKSKTLDPFFGRKVRGLIEQLGFIDVGQEGYTYIVRGGDPSQRWSVATYQIMARSMVTAGLFSQEQSNGFFRQLLDPTFYYPASTLYAAWGRRPT